MISHFDLFNPKAGRAGPEHWRKVIALLSVTLSTKNLSNFLIKIRIQPFAFCFLLSV